MFSYLSRAEIKLLGAFNLSSAKALNLVQSKNLSFGQESSNVKTMVKLYKFIKTLNI